MAKKPSLSMNLASNIETLRRKLGLNQAQLAKLAKIPRSTLTYMESGEGNPSLHSMQKVSKALGLSLDELLSQPHPWVVLTRKDDLSHETRGMGAVDIYKLLTDPIPGMEIDKMTLKPKGRMRGVPHVQNTKEFLYCIKGRVNVYVKGEKFEVGQGDLLAFPGDEPHAYENPDSKMTAICFSVVCFKA
jgi:XRE family transcriptional regulator, regulator of sulfur utilization